MQKPSMLYQLETDAQLQPTVAAVTRPTVLLVSLNGFMDAGGAQRLLTEHLLATLEHRVVATFDIDQLLDYRGRRPLMTYDKDHWADYADPSLALYRVVDNDGTSFYILNGPEPDYQWERFIEAARQLMRFFGISLTLTAHGIPMAVPHTRPIGVSRHATTPDLLGDHDPVFGTVKVPGSVAGLLELRIGEAGERACGFAVHVPHYLAQSDFPSGALAALEAIVAVSGLSLPDAALQIAAADNIRAIESEVAKAPEASSVVSNLEQQYDAYVAGWQRRALLSGDDSRIPTAEELGQEFEEFLRERAAAERRQSGQGSRPGGGSGATETFGSTDAADPFGSNDAPGSTGTPTDPPFRRDQDDPGRGPQL